MLRSEPLERGLGITNVGRQLRLLYSSTDGVDGKTPTVVSAAKGLSINKCYITEAVGAIV
jgi:hypothetical protein